MKKVLLVVGHQQSAQGAVNPQLGLSEWEFNSVLVAAIQNILGESAEVLSMDIEHWKKAPIINAMHSRTPYEAVLEFHLNACDSDRRVNYSLMKYCAGSARGEDLATRLIDVMNGIGVKPANWKETVPRGVFPTEKPPAKTDQSAEWWAKNGWRYRGAAFIHKTAPPAVLLEPFFISCTEFTKAQNTPEAITLLAEKFAAAIRGYLDA
jgi:hypothetical protein